MQRSEPFFTRECDHQTLATLPYPYVSSTRTTNPHPHPTSTHPSRDPPERAPAASCRRGLSAWSGRQRQPLWGSRRQPLRARASAGGRESLRSSARRRRTGCARWRGGGVSIKMSRGRFLAHNAARAHTHTHTRLDRHMAPARGGSRGRRRNPGALGLDALALLLAALALALELALLHEKSDVCVGACRGACALLTDAGKPRKRSVLARKCARATLPVGRRAKHTGMRFLRLHTTQPQQKDHRL